MPVIHAAVERRFGALRRFDAPVQPATGEIAFKISVESPISLCLLRLHPLKLAAPYARGAFVVPALQQNISVFTGQCRIRERTGTQPIPNQLQVLFSALPKQISKIRLGGAAAVRDSLPQNLSG